MQLQQQWLLIKGNELDDGPNDIVTTGKVKLLTFMQQTVIRLLPMRVHTVCLSLHMMVEKLFFTTRR